METKFFTAASLLQPLPFSVLNPSPRDPLSITSLGQKSILEGQIREGGQRNLSRGPESWKRLTKLPTRYTNTWAASSLLRHTMQSRPGLEGLRGEGELGSTGALREGTWGNLEKERTQSSALSSFCFSS